VNQQILFVTVFITTQLRRKTSKVLKLAATERNNEAARNPAAIAIVFNIFFFKRQNFVPGAWDISSGTQSRQVVSEYGGPNDYFVELQVLLGLALIFAM
jgi:hypothetical protein